MLLQCLWSSIARHKADITAFSNKLPPQMCIFQMTAAQCHCSLWRMTMLFMSLSTSCPSVSCLDYNMLFQFYPCCLLISCCFMHICFIDIPAIT